MRSVYREVARFVALAIAIAGGVVGGGLGLEALEVIGNDQIVVEGDAAGPSSVDVQITCPGVGEADLFENPAPDFC